MNLKSQVSQAVVLVGGLGTRLRPLTLERPKQMLPVANRPMLELVLSRLYEAGIKNAILSLGYKPDAFIEAYPDGICSGVKLSYAVEPNPLDTAGAIKYAIDQAGAFESESGTFLAVNGDVICDANLNDFFNAHFQKPALATLLSTRVKDPSQFGVIVTDEDSRIVEFHEKPDISEGYGNNINAGMYVLDYRVLKLIADDKPVSIEKDIFPVLVKNGSLFSWLSEEYWIDAGTPETYLQAQLDIAEKLDEEVISSESSIAESAKVSNSFISRGVEVGENAQIYGSVILDDAQIEKNSVVEDSIVGYRAHIGEGSTLSDFSIIGEGEKIPPSSELKAFKTSQ